MLIQIALAVFGLASLWMVMSGRPKAVKWAPVVGLIGQVFWLIATFGQWGMFIVSLGYTYVWGKAFVKEWM